MTFTLCFLFRKHNVLLWIFYALKYAGGAKVMYKVGILNGGSRIG